MNPCTCLAISLLLATGAAESAAATKAAPAYTRPATTTRTTVDGRPLASSLPQGGQTRRTGPKTLGFAELGQHLDENVEITSIHGSRRTGRVDSVSGSTLRLRVSAGAGFAIVNVEREQIRQIRDLD